MTFRAVIFDLGGVVFPSPFAAFDAYERANGLPDRFIRTVVAASADDGAWARLERSDTSFDEFCKELEAECAAAGGIVDASALMTEIGKGFAPRPEMVNAIQAIQKQYLLVAALTNNWVNGPSRETFDRFGPMISFDLVVESAVEGLRKPDPRIYELTCARLGVSPTECVFLDDLGVNLKPARAMGMRTIKVVDVGQALDELATVLGFALGEE